MSFFQPIFDCCSCCFARYFSPHSTADLPATTPPTTVCNKPTPQQDIARLASSTLAPPAPEQSSDQEERPLTPLTIPRRQSSTDIPFGEDNRLNLLPDTTPPSGGIDMTPAFHRPGLLSADFHALSLSNDGQDE